MDDIIPTSCDIDPITFLEVEMDTHQELVLGSGIILAPAPTNLQRLQEVPGLFTSGENLPGAEITPIITVPVADSEIEINNCSQSTVDITPLTFNNGNEETFEQSCSFIASLHGQIDDRRHICNVCQYKFKRMDHLKRHMMTHTIEEVLQAQASQQSGNVNNYSDILKGDVTLADDNRRFTCNVCHYKFKRADHLKRHMTRSHPEELALIAATEELAKARQLAKAAKDARLEDKSEKTNTEFTTTSVNENIDERRFACTLCDFKFKRRDHLTRHMTVHTDQIILPKEVENGSDICGDRTEEETLWLSSLRRFTCIVCEAKFKRADHLKRHMAKHNNGATNLSLSNNLEENGESSTQQTDLAVKGEVKYETVKNSFTIPNANIELPTKRIKNEKTDNEERRFVCNVCEYRFKRRFHLMRHMIKHTEHRLVNYGLAGDGENKKNSEEGRQNINFQNTRNTGFKQSLGPITFKCNVCDIEFKQPYRLKMHMARHSDERLFACPLCNYRAKLASNLKKHMLTHSDEKPFACHLCNYRGKLACALKEHIMLIHSDDKPFACDLCEFKAKVPSHLKKHMVSHQEEAPYLCTICDFKAKRAGNLKEHMATHTNEKRFLCNICSYGTRRQRNLRKHMAIHFEDKPYVCQLCPYRAKLPHYLKDHMKTHTTIKPYTCPFCDYKSRQSRQLKRHIQSHPESYGVNSMEITEMVN